MGDGPKDLAEAGTAGHSSAGVAAALLLVTLMTVLGLGFLTPVNVFVCLELQKANAEDAEGLEFFAAH